jgi:hypothetical protein
MVYFVTRQGLYTAPEPPPGRPFDFRHVAPFSQAGKRFVSSVMADAEDNSIWFGCAYSICHWKDGQLTVYGAREGVPDPSRKIAFEYLWKSPAGDLWALAREVLYVRKKGSRRFEAFPQQPPVRETVLPRIALNRAGQPMIPTDSGLAIWRGNRWDVMGQKNGLPNDFVSAAIVDRSVRLARAFCVCSDRRNGRDTPTKTVLPPTSSGKSTATATEGSGSAAPRDSTTGVLWMGAGLSNKCGFRMDGT